MSGYDNIIQFFAVWLDKKYLNAPFKNTVSIIDYYYQQINIFKNELSNKKFFLSIEGGEALENNLANLDKFYKLGVISLTLTWNHENNLAGGVNSECGLKKFGREVIDRMQELNMIIDISHASKKTFWDIYKYSKSAFIASHSNCRKICDHPRNLDDDQIIAIKERGGLIGLNSYKPFVNNKNKTDINHWLNHVDHLINLIGTDNICLGCDFDGANDLIFTGMSDMKKPYDLLKISYGSDIADKIFYANLKRFLDMRHYIKCH